MLARFRVPAWNTVNCDMVASRKEAFYEHTAFGTACCGARDKVRCLDSSTMCKSDADFKTWFEVGDGKPCILWDGILLAMFDGKKLNWGDVTCEEVASAKYQNDVMNLGKDKMSDALREVGFHCCGGFDKIKCGAASGLAPVWALILAASAVSVLSGW